MDLKKRSPFIAWPARIFQLSAMPALPALTAFNAA
jgi:hypothetical protein